MKKVISILLCLTMLLSVAAFVSAEENTTVSVSVADYATANSWTNGTLYDTIVMDSVITVTSSGTAVGNYGLNTGKYYDGDNTWRIYQSESPSVTISAKDATIVSVKISYNSNNSGVLTLNGSNIDSGAVVEVNGSSVTFSVGNTGTKTNGQARITGIEVVYSAANGGTTPDTSEPSTSEPDSSEPSTSEIKTITLNTTTLGIAGNNAYVDGSATVDGIGFSYIEIGDYGNGIQMRSKNDKSSTVWNTTAIPGDITKIVLVYNSAKSTYDNPDCFSFTFGSSADALNAEVKLSTVQGQSEYTIEAPEGEFSFFKMLHTYNYSFYWDSITIYYAAEASEPETTEPEVTEPETTTPETTAPETTAPEATKTPDDNGTVTPSTGVVPGVGYKIYANNGASDLWFTGTITSGRFDASANKDDAATVYVEEVTGGYLLYMNVDNTKTYIVMEDKSAGGSLTTDSSAATVYVWNGALKTLVVADEDNGRAFGAQDGSTYMNFSAYATSNETGYVWGQFIAEGSAQTGDYTISVISALLFISAIGTVALASKKKEF